MNRKSLLFIAGVALNIFIGSSQERVNLDLSSQPWNITLDHAAIWQNDELYLPPVDIKALPVNTPTGGWQLLKYPDKTGVNVYPAVDLLTGKTESISLLPYKATEISVEGYSGKILKIKL